MDSDGVGVWHAFEKDYGKRYQSLREFDNLLSGSGHTAERAESPSM